jgi:hypothetical protein
MCLSGEGVAMEGVAEVSSSSGKRALCVFVVAVETAVHSDATVAATAAKTAATAGAAQVYKC